MSKAGVVLGVLVVAGVAAGGYLYVQSKKPDLSPAGPNAELAPQSLAFYAEVPDLRGTWTTLQGHDSWRDFAASSAADEIVASPLVQDFLAAAEHVAAKAKYRVDEKNAMKFFGRECSVGVELDPAGGAPKVLLLTKLDTDAVAKDLLDGKTDLDALWAELQKRTSQCDVAVTSYEHERQSVATATRGASTFHATLLGDTLAIATDKPLLHAAIACRKSGGEGSLARKSSFAADMKALPAGGLREWYDLAALDAGRGSLDAALTSLGAKPAALTAAHAMLDCSKGAGSVARATSIPGGDLYQATWTYSKDADLFADKAAPALRDLFAGEWLVYAEAQDVDGLVKAWKGSALRRNLAQSEFGKWLDKTMDDPAPLLQKAAGLASGAMGGRGRRRGGASVEEAIEQVDRFAIRMGKHLAEDLAGKVLAGDASIAVEWSGEREALPKVGAAIRLGTDGRLFAHAAWAVMEKSEDPAIRIKAEPCGSRTIYSSGTEPAFHWTLVGDTFVGSNDRVFVMRAAETAGEGLAASPALRESIAKLKPGWRFFAHLDVERGLGMLEDAFGGDASPGGVGQGLSATFDAYREMAAVGRRIALAAYVPDDFGRFEMRGTMDFFPPATDPGRRVRQDIAAQREPVCWSFLPASTILEASSTSSGIPQFWGSMNSVLAATGAKEEAHKAFREAMQMDLERDLVPALGREFFYAAAYRRAPNDAPGGIVVPGILVGLEVKDAAVVKKAVDRACALIEEATKDEQHGNPVVREMHGGVEVVRLVPPPEQGIPVMPALALWNDYLLFSTEVETLRDCLDAKSGKGKRMRDTATFATAAQGASTTCATHAFIDWGLLVDQVQVYAPQIGQMTSGSDVPYPEFPENGDQEEWQRRVAEYQKKMEQAKGSGGESAKRWIESLRVVDWLRSSSTSDGQRMDFEMTVKFRD